MANLIYAGNYTIAKEVMPDYIGAYGMILLRVFVAAFIFTFCHLFFFNEPIKTKKDYAHLLLCALFGVAINQMMFFKGLSMTNPINPAIIMMATPIMVLIASFFLLKESLGWKNILGISLGVIGSVSLIISSASESYGLEQSNALGDVLVLINACSYGIYLVIVKPLIKKYHPITVMRWVFTFGLFIVIPFGSPDLLEVNWGIIDFRVWVCIAYVLVFVSVLAYFFNSWALVRVSPTLVSFYIYLQPVLAGVIAVSLGKDSLNLPMIICAFVIVVGVYFVSKK
jgi:drug/metabolite transporter (DMT)-like permease